VSGAVKKGSFKYGWKERQSECTIPRYVCCFPAAFGLALCRNEFSGMGCHGVFHAGSIDENGRLGLRDNEKNL